MNNMQTIKVPKQYLFMLNQLFEIEQKIEKIKEPNSVQRNIDRLKDFFETEALSEGQGLVFHNPIGEKFDETRTDCEARNCNCSINKIKSDNGKNDKLWY